MTPIYEFITIEGCIGAGKTSLVTRLCEDLKAQPVLEQFEDNPFLPGFYQDPEKHAFPVELYFMAERYRHLKEIVSRNLFSTHVVSDFMFQKSLLFALNNLGADEARLYRTLFDIINPNLPRPDITIYLHTPVELLLERIRIRGRSYELGIKGDYLEDIQQAYLRYFKETSQQRILILEAGELDLLNNPKHYDAFKQLLCTQFENRLYAPQRLEELI